MTTASQPVHALLLQFAQPSPARAHELANEAARVLQQTFPALALQCVAHQPATESYVYLAFDGAVDMSAATVQELERTLRTTADSELAQSKLSRLQQVLHRDGPSIASPASVHYVVEMDPEEGWQDELFRWYDEEHLPGLAAVEGTVRADRYLNLDHGPLSHACYDLTAETVMGCPAWLAVRATSWSSKVRPHFTNTKRTMFAKLA